MKRNPIFRKSILINFISLVVAVLILFIILNCSQPFSFSDVLDGSDDSVNNIPGVFSDIDYTIESISNSPSIADVSSAFSQSFKIKNQGSDPGELAVYWTAYLSNNKNLEGDDTQINSGITIPLQESSLGDDISITGNWPESAGIYYIIVNVSAGDDNDPSNNYFASDPFTINATGTLIDYKVNNISKNYPTVTSGSLCSETFDLTNIGGGHGEEDITWIAYASVNTSLTGAIEIGSGTLSALDSGSGYVSVPISGSWTNTADEYYIIIDIFAVDEDITGNNTADNGLYAVKDPPDYSILSANFLAEGVPGEALSATSTDYDFVITENGDNNGSQPIAWEVFASFDTILDGSDTSIITGNLSPLIAGDSSGSISFSDALWPDFGSYYYLIINISAGDDSDPANNSYVSPNSVTVPEFYLEGVEVNDDEGPWVNVSTFSNVSDLSGIIFPGTAGLDPYELVKISGLMDDINFQNDTYELILGSGVSTIELYAEWSHGYDTIDLYLWDTTGEEVFSDWWDINREPEESVFTITEMDPGGDYIPLSSGGTYYVGAVFIDNNGGDFPYSLFIHAKP